MTTGPLVLAFGGSTAAEAGIGALAAHAGADVVTLTVDLGQGLDPAQVRDRALACGAARAHVVDGRRELARDVVRPALTAGALADCGIDPGLLARPVITRHLAALARLEGARAVAHGARGGDRVTFEQLLHALEPDLPVIALADLPGVLDDAGPHVTSNSWGRVVTLASDDVWSAPPANLYTRTIEPALCAAYTAMVEIAFEHGVPVAVNGVALEFEELVEVVDTIAGDHGVGRADRTTARAGRRQRQIVEAPACEVLGLAIAELAAASLDPELLALRRQLAPAYASLIIEGRWHSPARAALDAFTSSSAAALTGVVRLQLTRGACRVVGRRLGAVAHEAPREAVST